MAKKTEKPADPKPASLLKPHVTERSSELSFNAEHPTYTFIVAKHFTKPMVRAAFKETYKLSPVRVNILNVRSKTVIVRGRKGRVPGFRKAMVTLKKGDKIDFV